MTEHGRINLDEMAGSRTPLDASWSAKKKKLVAGGAVVVAASVVTAGVWWNVSTRPPSLPKTVSEAVAILASSNFDRLDEDRQRQYTAEAARLFRELSKEERRAYFADEKSRDAMRKVRQERFDEVARAFARGDRNPFGDFRNGQRGDGQRPNFNRQNNGENNTNWRDQIRDRINDRMMQDAESGNAQDAGLREEMIKRRASQGGGSGRGGRGG